MDLKCSIYGPEKDFEDFGIRGQDCGLDYDPYHEKQHPFY
jgi:hypothetical protein